MIIPLFRPSERIGDLNVENSNIDDLNRWFRDNIDYNMVECQAFYEIKGIGGQIIVNRDSADPRLKGCIPIGINANHIDIAKPLTTLNPVYVSINDLIDYHLRKSNS